MDLQWAGKYQKYPRDPLKTQPWGILLLFFITGTNEKNWMLWSDARIIWPPEGAAEMLEPAAIGRLTLSLGGRKNILSCPHQTLPIPPLHPLSFEQGFRFDIHRRRRLASLTWCETVAVTCTGLAVGAHTHTHACTRWSHVGVCSRCHWFCLF